MPDATQQKIVELNQQLAQTRQERDELNNQAKTWAEKRNKLHEEIKALQTQAKALKEKRDEINLEVQILKAAREKARDQRTEKREQIAQIKEKMKAAAPRKPSTRLEDLEREIKNLEWKIQTSSLPVKEERVLVDRVKALEIQLALHRKLEQLEDKSLELQTEAKAFDTEAQIKHERLSDLAEQSQQHHQQLIEVSEKIKTLRMNADEAHQKYVESRQKADEAHERYVQMQQQMKLLKAELGKNEREQYEKRGLALKEEATRKAHEKMKRGEKLTWEEFKLLTDQDEEETEH